MGLAALRRAHMSDDDGFVRVMSDSDDGLAGFIIVNAARPASSIRANMGPRTEGALDTAARTDTHTQPIRLVDDIVWARANDGQTGVGQVLFTYNEGGRYEAPAMGTAEIMVIVGFAIDSDFLPRLHWVPFCAHWCQWPHPMWVVRWLSG